MNECHEVRDYVAREITADFVEGMRLNLGLEEWTRIWRGQGKTLQAGIILIDKVRELGISMWTLA